MCCIILPMKALITALIIIPGSLFVSINSIANDRIIEALIAEQNRIRTIDCTLTQLIYEDGNSMRYAGRYRADSKGRFRVDYTLPSKQTVLNTSGGLFWHMPGDNTLYIIQSKSTALSGTSPRGIGNLMKKIDDGMELKYLGTHLYGFFTVAHRFIMIDRGKGNKMEIIAGTRDTIILEKKVFDRDGTEVMREVYSDYTTVGGMKFPLRVDVFAKTGNGVTRSISFYRDIRLNDSMPDEVFRLKVPGNVRKMTYGPK
jgi:outer membrane lipoprotein-sorting protein